MFTANSHQTRTKLASNSHQRSDDQTRIKLASNSRQTRVKLTPNSRFYLIFENSRCYSEHSFRTPPMTCHIYGRSWVESKNRLTSQFFWSRFPSRKTSVYYNRSWVSSKNRVFSNFFVVAITSSKTSTKLLRTENPWILHFREKIFRRGRPLRGSRSHRKAPQAEIFFKNKQRWSKKAKKEGRPPLHRPAFFFCFFASPSIPHLMKTHEYYFWFRVKRASNARQTRVKRAANAHQVVLKFSAPNIGGDLSRSEIINTWY